MKLLEKSEYSQLQTDELRMYCVRSIAISFRFCRKFP